MNGALTSRIFAFPDDVGSALTDLGGSTKDFGIPGTAPEIPWGSEMNLYCVEDPLELQVL